MKAFGMTSPGIVGYFDAPAPELIPYGAILRPVLVAPCSSDVHNVFDHASPTKRPPNWIFGHEAVAEVMQVGEMVRDFRPGEIVAVPGATPDWRARGIQDHNFTHPKETAFSGMVLSKTRPGVFGQYFLVEDADTTLAKIPEGVDLESALMCVDMVTTGFTGVKYANIDFGDIVCVIGIGPVGLMAVAGAAIAGAGRIIAVGNRPKCVELAKEFGATDILNYKNTDIVKSVLEMTGGRGVDSTIVAGGGPDTIRQAMEMTCYGKGTICNINYIFGDKPVEIPTVSFGRGMGGKTIRTEHGEGGRVKIERMLQLVKFGRIQPSKLITHRYYGYDKLEEALYLMRDKPRDLVKAVVYIDWDKEK